MAFDPTDFKQKYPEFASLSDVTLNYLFSQQAVFYGYLTENMQEPNLSVWQDTIVAHLAALSLKKSVGRLSSAGEGSVSASWDYPSTPNSAWWVQTPYGATIWNYMLSNGGFTWYSGSRYR